MYNLHCHSLLSDGVLLPSEIARRFEEKGYKAIAITDHVDKSNIKFVTQSILEFCRAWPKTAKIKVLPGVELTHLPLEQIPALVKFCRYEGLKVIVGHGETPVEPVIIGTNRAFLEAGVDILAHPGLITEEDVKLAVRKNVFLEITSRKGHSDANAHVLKMAQAHKVRLVLNADSHTPADIISCQELESIAMGLGLNEAQLQQIYKDSADFISRRL